MKKLFILSCASIFMLTGCGATETLSCSFVNNANNGTTRVTYDIDHQEDEIKKVRVTYNYDFDTDNNTGNATGTTAGDMTRDVNDNNTTNNNDTADINEDADLTDGNTTNTTNDTNNNITGYNDNTNNTQTDGVGTGTDGTTNDSNIDDDGIVDGIVGSAIDSIVGGVTSVILDAAGLRDRHATVQNTYGNVAGFSAQNTNDVDNNYKVTYVIDYDTISDADLATFNFSRDLDTMRNNYVNQGFTCK